MKEFLDSWIGIVVVFVILLGLTFGLCAFINWALIHDLECDLKIYQDFHECVINGVDYRVCEIEFIK